MADFSSWVESNWSSVVGAVGIIGSLLYTAAYFREDSRNRLVANLLAIDERHRALWGEIKQRPELKRILSENVDLENEPLTPAETVSMWEIVQQFETGWRLEKIMNRGELKNLARDVAHFFGLPLPLIAWNQIKCFRNPKFVKFVEQAMTKKSI